MAPKCFPGRAAAQPQQAPPPPPAPEPVATRTNGQDASQRMATRAWSDASSSADGTSTTMTESSLRSSTDTYRAGSRWFLTQPPQAAAAPVEEEPEVRA